MNTEISKIMNSIWSRLIPALEKSLNKPIYEALISSTKPLTIINNKLTVAVPNEIVKDWLSKHCITLMEQEVKSFGPEISRVEFVVCETDLFTTPILERETSQPEKATIPSNPFLNPRYTFETFVVGHGNRFAHAASLAVAEAPAKAYNPLFLYGGGGLGKTHLMQAVGQQARARNRALRVSYLSAEKFTNEVIHSLRFERVSSFRDKYRTVDVLLLDDIQ